MNGSLRITNALIFDGWSSELIEGGIRIVDGEIVEVGDVKAGGDDRCIDAAGGTVIPGLIDAHFHAYAITLHLDVNEMTPLSYVALAAARRLSLTLRRGFTTVRDVAGGDAGLASAIAGELLPSPRYFYTGAGLSQTGGHGDPRSSRFDQCLHGGCSTEVVDGVDAVRLAARDRFRRGAHAIKMMTSGGVISLDDPIRQPQYSSAEIQAVVDEAVRRGSYVVAHAYSPEAIRHSVENGIRSIEHGNLLDKDVAALMAAKGAFLVPTLATYDAMDRRGADLGLTTVSQAKNREVLDAGKEAIVLARSAGVQIGFGSDLMGELEDDQLIGLRLQMEPDGILNTLRSVTSGNADLLGHRELGRIAIECTGDLVILDGNPFEDPAALWDVQRKRTVVQSGRVVV